MAPIKFEEQIKDKLEQRTVSPSPNAWSKLSQQLDAEDNRNKKSAFWWIGIAASIAALVMISISYFNNKTESTKIDEVIVNDKIEEVITPKTEANFTTNEVKTSEKQELVIKQKASEKLQKVEGFKEELNAAIKTKQKEPIQSQRSSKAKTVVAKVEKQKSAIQKEIIKPKTEIKSVIAELQNIKTQEKNATVDKEVDSLLKLANKELFMDKALRKKGTVVNADALLQDVEDDMGQSFRTKIYEALKGGLKEVKKAVAQRNDN